MIRMLLLMRADPAASLRIATTGVEGADAQRAAIEALGGAVEGQWGLLGQFDLAVVAVFPDQAVAAAYCLAANAGGFATETHIALEPVDLELAKLVMLGTSPGDERGADPDEGPVA